MGHDKSFQEGWLCGVKVIDKTMERIGGQNGRMSLYWRQSSERFLNYRSIYFYRLKRFPFHQFSKHRASGNGGSTAKRLAGNLHD